MTKSIGFQNLSEVKNAKITINGKTKEVKKIFSNGKKIYDIEQNQVSLIKK